MQFLLFFIGKKSNHPPAGSRRMGGFLLKYTKMIEMIRNV